jgi:hypothetical protein
MREIELPFRSVNYIKQRISETATQLMHAPDLIIRDNIAATLLHLENVNALDKWHITMSNNGNNSFACTIDIKPIEPASFVTFNVVIDRLFDIVGYLCGRYAVNVEFRGHVQYGWTGQPSIKGIVGVCDGKICDPSIPSSDPYYVLHIGQYYVLISDNKMLVAQTDAAMDDLKAFHGIDQSLGVIDIPFSQDQIKNEFDKAITRYVSGDMVDVSEENT